MRDDWTHMDFNVNWEIPNIPAVYFLMNIGINGFIDDVLELIYIGQTKNLRQRISIHEYHLNVGYYLGDKYFGETTFDSFFYIPTGNSTDARLVLEAEMIEMYFPKLNNLLPKVEVMK